MTDTIYDDIIHEGRQIRVTWRRAAFMPPRALVTQASGVCFTEEGRVVLVTKDGASWHLVGGHPELGEIIEQAFVREVAEETGAEVLEMRYLGAQEVNDPGNPDGKVVYYQARTNIQPNARTNIQPNARTNIQPNARTNTQPNATLIRPDNISI